MLLVCPYVTHITRVIVDSRGLFYKTKTPLNSHQLASDKAFKRGSSFYRFTRSFLRDKNPVDFASACAEERCDSVFKLSVPQRA